MPVPYDSQPCISGAFFIVEEENSVLSLAHLLFWFQPL